MILSKILHDLTKDLTKIIIKDLAMILPRSCQDLTKVSNLGYSWHIKNGALHELIVMGSKPYLHHVLNTHPNKTDFHVSFPSDPLNMVKTIDVSKYLIKIKRKSHLI